MAPPIVLHLPAALAALILGGWMLARPKGTQPHRIAGRVWAGLMLTVALTSLWIPAFLRFSWIHGFTLLILVTVPAGVLAIRRGDRRRHRRFMIGSYLGLVGAGIGALAPGRIVGGAVWSALGLR